MSVSYEYYKIFYYVAKYRSFNKAAGVLMNSQPNITRTINNLESELGVKLFDRFHTGVKLTAEGEILYEHVKTAQRHFEIAEEALESIRELRSGNISIGFSIGITDLLINDMILPVLRNFHNSYPDVHLQIFNNTTPKLLEDVGEGALDIAIVTTLGEHKKNIRESILYSFRDIVIAGNIYKKQVKEPLSIEELVKYPLVSLWHGTETFDFYNTFFATNGITFKPSIETAATDQVLNFVESNMGIGFIYPETAKKSIAKKNVFELDTDFCLPVRNISMIFNESLAKGSAAYILEQMFTEKLRSRS